MSEMREVLDWCNSALQRLSTSERRKLALTIAKEMRSATQASMQAQTTPDGDAWEPRKAQQRLKNKKQKKEMFVKMRAAKNLKAKATANEAWAGFVGRTARIARVHHYGLHDKPGGTYGRNVQYAKRELIGITPDMQKMITDQILQHLGGEK